MLLREIGLFLLTLTALSNRTNAGDWRQFRGPDSNGVIRDIILPEVWGMDSSIKWKVSVPGEGWSAPIVVGKKVFVTTGCHADGERNGNIALDEFAGMFACSQGF